MILSSEYGVFGVRRSLLAEAAAYPKVCSLAGFGRARKSSARGVVLCGIVLLLFICLGGTVAYADERPRDFDIPASKASKGLALFAEQSGIPLIYLNENVRNKRTNRVVGSYTAIEALEILLSGTGIEGSFNERRVLTVTVEKSGDDVESKIVAEIEKSPEGKGESVRKHGVLAGLIAAVLGTAATDGRADQETPPESAPAKLNEIVVTAQKRQERLQDVPISITVLEGRDLDRSTAEGITEALTSVPGVATMAALQGGGTQVAVRGVTAAGALFSGSSPIAYYLDSVPFGLIKTAIAPDSNAFDLQRVEVLRGPQGTLYGASAQNGVVRVLTNDADLDEFELKARASASGTEDGGDNYRGDMALNVPIVEGRLGARLVAGYQDLSGWIDKPNDKDANDAEIQNFRLKVNAEPTERLSIGLSAWLSRAEYGAPNQADSDYTTVAVLDETIDTDYDAYGLKIGYDFSAVSLVSMTSYIDYENRGDLDLTPFIGVALPIFTELTSEVFSEEIVLSSVGEALWRWSLGAMYRDGEDRLLQEAVFFPLPIDFSDTSESLAIFGEVTRVFADGQFEVTGGLRYFEDDVTQIENVPQSGNPSDPLIPPDSRTFDATSPRVVLTWHPDEELTVYASYSEGFRSGFNQNANVIRLAPQFPPLEPDTLENYEIGTKGNVLDGRVSFDAAVFYIDWQDVQQIITVDAGLPVTAAINGVSASGIGAEIALMAEPVDGLSIGASVSWNDLTMDEEVRSFPSDAPPEGAVLFEKGDRLNFSPEYTAGASLAYLFPLGASELRGRFGADATYMSKQVARDVVGGVLVLGTGDEILTARTSFGVEAERWTASIFADNVTDENGAPVQQVIGAPWWSQSLRPRTIGVQFELRF